MPGGSEGEHGSAATTARGDNMLRWVAKTSGDPYDELWARAARVVVDGLNAGAPDRNALVARTVAVLEGRAVLAVDHGPWGTPLTALVEELAALAPTVEQRRAVLYDLARRLAGTEQSTPLAGARDDLPVRAGVVAGNSGAVQPGARCGQHGARSAAGRSVMRRGWRRHGRRSRRRAGRAAGPAGALTVAAG